MEEVLCNFDYPEVQFIEEKQGKWRIYFGILAGSPAPSKGPQRFFHYTLEYVDSHNIFQPEMFILLTLHLPHCFQPLGVPLELAVSPHDPS